VTWSLVPSGLKTRLAIEGDLSEPTDADELLQKVEDLLSRGILWLDVDLARCNYLSSCGIAILIRIQKRVAESGGTLMVVAANDHVRGILAITRCDRILMPQAPKNI
jgi:anti-anti-sigma factor